MPRETPLEAAEDAVVSAVEGQETVTTEIEVDVEAGLDALDTVDRQNKIGRTTIQAGVSAAAVTVTEYVLAYFDADLDPWADGYQDHFPPVFTGALFVLFASAAAWWMNRKPRA